jgi:hypothetical protein
MPIKPSKDNFRVSKCRFTISRLNITSLEGFLKKGESTDADASSPTCIRRGFLLNFALDSSEEENV